MKPGGRKAAWLHEFQQLYQQQRRFERAPALDVLWHDDTLAEVRSITAIPCHTPRAPSLPMQAVAELQQMHDNSRADRVKERQRLHEALAHLRALWTAARRQLALCRAGDNVEDAALVRLRHTLHELEVCARMCGACGLLCSKA